MVGNNRPIFFLRDPMKFQHFIRSQKRRADSCLRDNDMQLDFSTLSPESAYQVTWLMGDRGIPKTWRHMDGFSSHTYMWVNADGQKFWVKYHFKTDQGNEFLTQADADRIAGEDADYHRRDLFNSIRAGDYPCWTLHMQIMPFEEARGYRLNPFDLTKVWPHGDYPLIEVGKLTLDRNPTDFHTEIEQAAFEPSNLVSGIGLSPDKMLLGRGFAYADAHHARLGTNYEQIPVNRPKSPLNSYSKDGAMRAVLMRREIGVIVIIVAIAILFEALSGTFLSMSNMRNVFGVAPEVGIVAIGVALLMVTGEFDISVGAVFAFAPMASVVMIQAGVPISLALIIALVLCVGLGLANAFVTLRLNIPSFIATLGTMFIIRSVVVLLSGGMPPLFPADRPTEVFTGWVGPIRAALFWYVGIIVIFWYLQARTNFGNWVYATGGDTQAARDLGVATDRVKTAAFALCAHLAGFAGIIQSQRVGTALTSAGVGLELEAIAAAVIGGVALRGGVGTIFGAVLGALLIRLIDNGLVMARIDANYFRGAVGPWGRGAVGTLIIVAVVFNEALYRIGRRIRVQKAPGMIVGPD